jgi:hypothetical protein
MNLTIIDKIELPILTSSFGGNFYTKSQFSLPIFVKKGYLPIMKRSALSSPLLLSTLNNINTGPDYFCLNANMSLNINSHLFNCTKISMLVEINFVFNNPNQTVLSNYTINHVYDLFGSFTFYVYTLFGGNILTNKRLYVNVQRIETYPFQSIEIKQFNLNCSLNEMRLDCILRVNLSNYANSFQQITIDYGDGISFDSFMINPYCKYYIIIIYN